MKRRVLSLFLAFALCFSSLPLPTFAEETDVVTEQEETDVVTEQEETEVVEEQEETDAVEEPETEAAEEPEAPDDESTADEGSDTEEGTDIVDSADETVSESDVSEQDAKENEEVAVQAIGESHEAHPICGDPDCTEEDHQLPAGEEWTAISSFAEMKAAMHKEESTAKAGYYYLTNDITWSWDRGLWLADDVTLCLNGHSIIASPTHQLAIYEAIRLYSGNTFTLCDCKGGGTITHTEKESGYTDRGIVVGGTFNMYGGSITGSSSISGAGVSVGGTFNMYGGSITKNMARKFDAASTSDATGGGVHVGSGTFNMFDGEITGNSGEKGAGVYVGGGTFNMKGGTISGNTAMDTFNASGDTAGFTGGGVYVKKGTFNMTGGTIAGNTAHGNGAGVYIANIQYNTFNMSGGEISGNKAAGSGGGVYSLNGDIVMTGGTIADNTAGAEGGGVHIGDGSTVVFKMTGGTITGNTAGTNGGGVYVKTRYSYIRLSGKVDITGNTTGNKANNVYLCSNNTITVIGDLAADAQIGVTVEKIPEKGNFIKVVEGTETHPLTANDENCFILDIGNNGYVLEKPGDSLIIKKDGDNTLHHHPVCGETTCTHVKDGSAEHQDVYWQAVSTLSDDMRAGYYYLTQNVTLTKSWDPADGIVLDLNGHDIILNADNASVISKFTAGTFTLTDCMGGSDKYGKITHGENFTGGGIYLNSSYTTDFVMYGGSVTGNTGADAGVCLTYSGNYKKTFTMYGGEITNNTNTYTSSSYPGGGVYVACGNTFTMTGGKITGNTTATTGGGVYVEYSLWSGSGIFNVSSDAQITGNYKKDGTTADNVYLKSETNGTQAYINVNGALSDTANISVNVGTIDEGSYKVAAQGSDYTLTEKDRSRFSSDERYDAKLVGNSIAFVKGEQHEHAVCGETDCTETGHDNVLWTPLTYNAKTQELMYGSQVAPSSVKRILVGADDVYTYYTEYKLPAGNYYLVDDISLTGGQVLYGGQVQYGGKEVTSKGGMIRIGTDSTNVAVNFCLNGKTLSTTLPNIGVIVAGERKALTLCDCGDNGQITSGCNVYTGVQVYSNNVTPRSVFAMYGGTISGSYTGVYALNDSDFKMYGGTITGNKNGVEMGSGTMTAGGSAKVVGNTTKNVGLGTKSIITIDPGLTGAASFGVTTYKKPTDESPVQIATGATNADLNYTQIFTADEKDKNYVVTKDENGYLYLGIHQHHWVCSAEGAVIRLKCTADGCSLGDDFTTTYTLKAPADLVYNGRDKNATIEVGEAPAGATLPAVSEITYKKYNGTEFVAFEGIPKDVGTYQATVSVTDSDKKTVSADVTFAIVKASLTVTANPRDIIYGAEPADNGVTYKGFAGGENESSLNGTLTYSYDYKQYEKVGSYTITPGGLTSDNYEITYVPGTLTVGQREVTLTWNNTEDRTYGDGKGEITAAAENLVNNDAISVSVSDNELTAGTHTAKATELTGDKAGNYKLPDDSMKEYTISEAAQTLKFIMSGEVTKTYGDGSFLNNARNDRADGSTVTYSSSDTKVAVVDAAGKVTIKGAGKAIITASALAVDGKYSAREASYTLTVEKKTLTAADLEFTGDSIFTKIYDGSTDCTSAVIQIKSDAKVDAKDELPVVTGTYAYNSADVKEADKVIFASAAADSDNYILPAGLVLEHEASIKKAKQAPLTITSTTVTYGTDLALTVSGGSGDGEVTYTVEDGTGAATVTGSTLHPVRTGKVTVIATKSGGDNYDDVISQKTVITITKADYANAVNKVVNIIKNRGTVQNGTLTAADFFPEGQMPENAVITEVTPGSKDMITSVTVDESGMLQYSSKANIASVEEETFTVTITTANYKDIIAALTFRPTDKRAVTILGLTYEDKSYDGNAMKPDGTLTVSDNKVPVDELEVRYEGTNGTTYDSTEAPVDAGTYKVTYKVADSNDDYIGSVEYTFTISPKTVTEDMIGAMDAQQYTGSEIKPEPTVKNGEITMISGIDFVFSYADNTNAGEATVTITGNGNYTGTVSRTFTIKPKNISDADIALNHDSLVYTGQMQEVQITSVTLGGVTLTAADYDIKSDSNKHISVNDKITLTIEGKGNYTGTATTIWKIIKADPALENFEVTPDLATAQTYDGVPKMVTAKVKSGVLGMGTVTVYYEGISGTNYARSTAAPVNAGKYEVIAVVADDGTNYNAKEIEIGMLTINKAAVSELEIKKYYEFPQTGEQTVNLADQVPGVTGYELGTITGDTGILSDVTVDADGIVKYTLNGTGKEGDTVTLPLTIRSANYEDTNINVVIALTMEYKIIEGADSSWKRNSKNDIVIRGNGDFAKFQNVKVDGEILDSENYTVEAGSTVITLKASYLKTLSKGSHSFEILWTDGSAGTDFKVVANSSKGSHNSNSNNSNNSVAGITGSAASPTLVTSPNTGDDFDIWLILFAMSLAGTVGLFVRRKKY